MNSLPNDLSAIDDPLWDLLHERLDSLAPSPPPIATRGAAESFQDNVARERLHRAVYAVEQLLSVPTELRSRILAWVVGVTPAWLEPWWRILEEAAARVSRSPFAPATRSQAATIIAAAFSSGSLALPSKSPSSHPAIPDPFESWYARRYPTRRRQWGVFHTPPELARMLWHRTGLSASSAEDLDILDPAAGVGTFLCAACHVEAERAGHRPASRIEAVEKIVSRFDSIEISLDAWSLGPLLIAKELDRIGHDLIPREPLRWWLADATDPLVTRGPAQASAVSSRVSMDSELQLWQIARNAAMSRQRRQCIIGNPPYSSRVEGSHGWIEQLLRGRIPGPGGEVNYFQCQGKPLGERKTWLHDLYVRFLRLSHWWTAESDRCCVALITNRGWLDHTTFRGLREAILKDFPEIRIDLPLDEKPSWFNVATPVAMVTLRRESKTGSCGTVSIHRSTLEGALPDDRQLAQGMSSAEGLSHVPQPPKFTFLVEESDLAVASGWANDLPLWKLTEIFLESGSTIVTGRDALTIAASRQEARERLESLFDPSVSDAWLIERYLGRSRSRRYPPGESRGWSLSLVRDDLRRRFGSSRQAYRAMVRPCRYRALDDHWLLYDPALVAWPRLQAQATLLMGHEALVTRRQSPPDRPFDFVTAVNRLVVDGVLRSDNRGNETLFPRFRFVAERLESNWSPSWISATDRLMDRVPTENLDRDALRFGYVFAMLRSPTLRDRFRRSWTSDYPAIPLLEESQTFMQLARLGRALADLHQSPLQGSPLRELEAVLATHDATIQPERALKDLPAETRAATLGAHRIVERWMRQRSDRRWSAVVARRFSRLVRTVEQCQVIEGQIDQQIQAWEIKTRELAVNQ